MKDLYYEGTKFSIELENGEKEIFMLVECHEVGFVFQLVCIEGFHAGQVFGLIENQRKKENAIDIIALKNALVRNVFGYNPETNIELF